MITITLFTIEAIFYQDRRIFFVTDVFFGHNFLFFKDTFFTSDREPISNIKIKTKDFRAHILIFLDTFNFFFFDRGLFFIFGPTPP